MYTIVACDIFNLDKGRANKDISGFGFLVKGEYNLKMPVNTNLQIPIKEINRRERTSYKVDLSISDA